MVKLRLDANTAHIEVQLHVRAALSFALDTLKRTEDFTTDLFEEAHEPPMIVPDLCSESACRHRLRAVDHFSADERVDRGASISEVTPSSRSPGTTPSASAIRMSDGTARRARPDS